MVKKIIIALSDIVPKKEINNFIYEMRKQASFKLVIEEVKRHDDMAFYFTMNTLVITDKEEAYKRACHKNLPVLIYFHNSSKYTSGNVPSFPNAHFGITTLNGIDAAFLQRVYQRYYNIPWHILDTKRCSIREMTVKDLEGLYQIYSEPSITEYMENLYENRQKEEEYTRAYIQEHYRYYGYGLWIIFDKHTGSMIGRAGITNRDGFEQPELGYMISKPFQGKGYAYEVCKAILEYCKAELEIYDLNAFVEERNLVSIHLLKKLGFTLKGEIRLNELPLIQYIYNGRNNEEV